MPRLTVVVIIYSHWDFLAQSMAIQLEKITINFKAYLSWGLPWLRIWLQGDLPCPMVDSKVSHWILVLHHGCGCHLVNSEPWANQSFAAPRRRHVICALRGFSTTPDFCFYSETWNGLSSSLTKYHLGDFGKSIFLWSGDKPNAKQVPVRDVVSWILVSPGEFSCPKELLAKRPKKLLHWKGHGVRPAGPEGKLLRFRWVLEHGRGQKVAPKQNRSETAQPSSAILVRYCTYIIELLYIVTSINIEHWNILSSYILWFEFIIRSFRSFRRVAEVWWPWDCLQVAMSLLRRLREHSKMSEVMESIRGCQRLTFSWMIWMI